MPNYVIYALWALAAGAVIPVMATINSQLARTISHAPLSVLIYFVVGFASAAVYALCVRMPLPDAATLLNTKPYLFSGGVLVTFYIISVTLLIPVFGVGNTILFIVCAQMFSSAIIDNWGLFGVAVRPVSWLRLLGILVMLAGLALIQLGAGKSN